MAAILLCSLLLLLVSTVSANYTLTDNLDPNNFFGAFQFFDEADPTKGHVKYVDRTQASGLSLAGFLPKHDNQIYLGVDWQNQAPDGRTSLRISSKKTYNKGLFILDVAHMPGQCGAWPAWWLLGDGEWPSGGEIDIVEGVNAQAGNIMALHTGPNCAINTTSPADFSGKLRTSNCDVDAPGQPPNAGCGVSDPRPASYGPELNAAGGGAFAAEWTARGISIWFFARDAIPEDVAAGAPAPNTWGNPAARFAGPCDFDAAFRDMRMIFDTTFCGDWAGSVWDQDAGCKALAPTCAEYVEKNPEAFKQAYWGINYVKVFEKSG